MANILSLYYILNWMMDLYDHSSWSSERALTGSLFFVLSRACSILLRLWMAFTNLAYRCAEALGRTYNCNFQPADPAGASICQICKSHPKPQSDGRHSMILFSEPVVFGRLKSRYKRFFMDVVLESSETVVAHTPNTGSMLGLLQEHALVMLTRSDEPKRRTAYTVQAIKIDDTWVGVNTHMPNRLLRNSLGHPLLHCLSGYAQVSAEVPYGKDLRSRVDFLLSDHIAHEPPLYLELKSVTLCADKKAQFPDSPSARARKHIEDLLFAQSQGLRAAIFFIVQRTDCICFSPAATIDRSYSELLAHAHVQGLTIKALSAAISERGIELVNEIPCLF